MKVVSMFIFRFALGMPLLSTTAVAAAGVAAVPASLAYLMSKIQDYKDYREIDQCFESYKLITSNLEWSKKELLLLVHEAFHYKHQVSPIRKEILDALEARIEGLLDACDKFKDGTIVKQFNHSDEMLDRLVIKEITESQARGEDIEELKDWVDI